MHTSSGSLAIRSKARRLRPARLGGRILLPSSPAQTRGGCELSQNLPQNQGQLSALWSLGPRVGAVGCFCVSLTPHLQRLPGLTLYLSPPTFSITSSRTWSREEEAAACAPSGKGSVGDSQQIGGWGGCPNGRSFPLGQCFLPKAFATVCPFSGRLFLPGTTLQDPHTLFLRGSDEILPGDTGLGLR